ncbi:6636_t:CDS:2 [Cetraspora pellucida]|uniref:6636_t:CDS:1 n=1 Tax=Cetraspora pellucida TaxID=1433469 RepID=A0A9N9G1K8_9GLOM|nr:6636_t:CDS:2 [Cetraspora pellucida]
MNAYFVQTTFKSLRILHLIFTVICIILELVEAAAFAQFAPNEGIPVSAYFSGQIYQYNKDGTQYYYNGVKIFSYIVILLTLLDAGLANIYPTFQGYSYSCSSSSSYSVAQECVSKLLFIVFGWIIGVLFVITSFLSYKLWSERREMYDGEWRVEALGEVVYKYNPKPNVVVEKVNEPEQVMIYKIAKNDKVRGSPSLHVQSAAPRSSTSD